jgi:thiazole/oxazole-forming peptide maturase SagD family component
MAMNKAQINKLLESLNELGFAPQISRNVKFHDEPQFFNFNTYLTIPQKYTDGKVGEGEPHGSGVSYFKPEEAISKSIWEAMERACNYAFHKKEIKFLKSKGSNFLDLKTFSKDPEIIDKKIGWVEGWDLFENRKIFIPAQNILLNYQKRKNEPRFDYPQNSTGSAGGNSPEMAILNGIYEIVERDSLMGIYLNKLSPNIVDLANLKDSRIDYIVEQFRKYDLELYILDATTDLGIPAFLSICFDRTGAGPAVGIGAKAGLKVKDIILGAMGEVLMTRLYTKSMLQNGEISADLKTARGLFPNRAKLWITTDTIEKIEFIISGKKDYRLQTSDLRDKMSIKQELNKVLKMIKQKGYKVYYTDRTIPEFKKLNFYTCFTIIPGLHPLYLHEHERERVINTERLTQIAKHFGKEFNGLNQVPHPFL